MLMQTQLMLPPKKHFFTTPQTAALPVKRPESGNTWQLKPLLLRKWTRGPDWMPDEEIRLSQLCKENHEISDGVFRGKMERVGS